MKKVSLTARQKKADDMAKEVTKFIREFGTNDDIEDTKTLLSFLKFFNARFKISIAIMEIKLFAMMALEQSKLKKKTAKRKK